MDLNHGDPLHSGPQRSRSLSRVSPDAANTSTRRKQVSPWPTRLRVVLVFRVFDPQRMLHGLPVEDCIMSSLAQQSSAVPDNRRHPPVRRKTGRPGHHTGSGRIPSSRAPTTVLPTSLFGSLLPQANCSSGLGRCTIRRQAFK